MDSDLTGYRSALERLFARTGSTSKFGLERTEALLSLVGNPEARLRCFHLAGTNGKGSVVATLYSLLRARGMSVGRYTSPHLVDFRERIVVDDEPISETEVVGFLARWEPDCERLGTTFFEITTALALDHFASRRVDVALIETGLGGRLDSTNVITPVVAGVTSIGIDHTEYLGQSIAEIAREKAGIFKPRVPAVFGRVSGIARDVLLDVASNVGAHPVIAAEELYHPANARVSAEGTTFEIEHGSGVAMVRTGLVGFPQASNACVALAMLDAAGAPFRFTLAEAAACLPAVTLAGRFQRTGKFILDVAHNPEAITALVETLSAVDPERPVIAVLSVLGDKDWREIIRILSPTVDEIILTKAPSAPANRAWDPAEALDFAQRNSLTATLVTDFDAALRAAAERAATVLVTGSFHTVGDALVALRPQPPSA